MKTKAVRMYGALDLRLEEFELPEICADEVLMRVVTDSLCASTYKAVKQGSNHKRVPENISEEPIIIGHEMCGEIIEVGENLKSEWRVGDRAVIQPALKLESGYDPGYSYKCVGGAATYVVVPKIVIERGCLVHYRGDSFFKGSLVESIGCVLRGYKGFYHTDYTNYKRTDGAKRGGRIAILGGAGPMGISAVELAKGYAGVGQIVVTDLSEERLEYARGKCTVENAAKCGCELIYLNTSRLDDPKKTLIEISDGGFDDVFVMVPVPALFSMAEEICREDGCVNFFAGPAVKDMAGSVNLYRIHYDGIHVVGTAGSIPEDTVDTITLIENEKINPAVLVSHIMGLNEYISATLAFEKPSGVKKICYTGLDIPYIAIDELEALGEKDSLYLELSRIVKKNGGLWCYEAEKYLLENAPKIKAKNLTR
ncbi:MAG: zinc-binding dehydrogenase [Clostridia bacterium]|nr:zinc-binding dehydrogenase [Clostridia bacterium]